MNKKRNENRPGYKKTKVGWIPEEWREVLLNEIGVFSKGKGIAKKDLSGTGLQCIRYGEIYTTDDFVITRFKSRISPKIAANSTLLQNNDLLFAGSGETLEDIGKSIAYIGSEEAYAGGDIVILSCFKDSIQADFLSYYLNTQGRHSLRSLGQGQSVVHIYVKHLTTVFVPLPPLPEQKAIASVLECWDRAIHKYEEKIEKKRNIKKGLMQRLLSGKQRLPGFEGKWVDIALGDSGKIVGGGTPSTSHQEYWNGKIPWCIPSEIAKLKKKYIDTTERSITTKGLNNSSANLLPMKSVIVCTRATVGNCAMNSVPMTTNQEFKSIVPNNLHYSEFLYYMILRKKKHLIRYASGSTFLEISKQDFSRMKLNIPSLPEQKAIASVLSSADSEIKAFEKKLAVVKEQKKYLLNNLVTGTIRLPEFRADGDG